LPSKIRRFTGNPGKRAINKDEPEPTVPSRAPPAPRLLKDPGKAEWRRMCKILMQMGLLTDADMTVLLAYCKQYETWLSATKKAEEFGPVIMTTNGNMVQSPWVGIANTAYSNMMRAAVEFGVTPAARSRVQVPKSQSAGGGYPFGRKGAA
jgi:P27 family predicted phage terminase small subunit